MATTLFDKKLARLGPSFGLDEDARGRSDAHEICDKWIPLSAKYTWQASSHLALSDYRFQEVVESNLRGGRAQYRPLFTGVPLN